ncbi:MAG: hypothetical protein RMM06_05725 [Armatimonadota bacterium]|nr:hypothetical protein [Armatimonadota bacterium]
MSLQPPEGDWHTASQYTERKGQLLFLQVRLVMFVVLVGGVILLYTVMLLQDIWNCFTLGCSALLPMRIRSLWAPVQMPVHVHIAFDGAMLLFLLFALRMGYSELSEQIQKQRAHSEFEAVMQRIRSGEDIDSILADLKKRKGQ